MHANDRHVRSLIHMKKEHIIGIGAVATVVVIGAAVASLSPEERTLIAPEKDESNTAKIEELYFDQLKDAERYRFCIGEERISGTYSSSLMGEEEGEVSYYSKDVSVFDKERNKLLILARTIDYTYKGALSYAVEIGMGTTDVIESGKTTEYFKLSSAPARGDGNSLIFFPAPERKTNDWVNVVTKGVGSVTIMGMTSTETRVDNDKGDAKVFCAPFAITGAGSLDPKNAIEVRKECPDVSPSPETHFAGDVTFSCTPIGNNDAITMLRSYKAEEEVANTPLPFPEEEKSTEEAIRDAVEGSQTYEEDPEIMRMKLEEMRKELQEEGVQ